MTEDRAISLNAVIATIYNSTGNFKNNFDQGFFADKIRELPPVTPTDEEMAMQYQRGYIDGFHEGKATFEPKTGHWIGIDEEPHEVWECDHCGFVIDGSGCIDPYDYRDTYKFCPHCGCAMVEPQKGARNDL